MAPSASFLYEPEEPAHKRPANTFSEIHNFLQESVKKIRTEPVALVCAGKQVQYGGGQVPGGAWQHELPCLQSVPSGHGLHAFSKLSDADLEFLQECLAKETRARPDHQYLATTQPEIDGHKRLVLVDWLVEVVDEFGLSQEALFLAVSLLDRFLSLQEVPRCQLQLLGVTCLWVAAKYEEVVPPCLTDFVEITDNSYAAPDLIRMEAALLATLRFELALPTPLLFLHQLLSHAQAESGCASPRGPCHPDGAEAARLVHMAQYLLELGLLTPETLRYRPSVVAAAALQLAADLLAPQRGGGGGVAAACGALCRGLAAAAATRLDGCMEELRRMLRWAGSAPQPPCVMAKYSDERHGCVASMQPRPCW